MRTLLRGARAASVASLGRKTCGALILSAISNVSCQGRIGDAIEPRDPGGRTSGAGASTTGTGAATGTGTATGTGIASNSSTPPANSLSLLRTGTVFGNAQLSVYALGSALNATEVAALDARLAAYLTAVGA